MDFAFTDIQDMLKDSAEKFVSNDYGFEHRQALVDSDKGYSEEHWQLFAELGWLALPFEEAYGGLDGTAVDIMVLMQTLGKGLLVEPYLSTVVLGGGVISRLGTEAQKEQWLPAIAGGELKVALAACEAQDPWALNSLTTTAEASGEGYVLNGHKAVVLHAQSADVLLVAANAPEGLTVFAVKPDAEGVSLREFVTNDGGRAADITLTNVAVSKDSVVGEAGQAEAAVRASLNMGVIAVCAEAIGLMERLLDATVEYTRVRKQFDTPIARFQVLQHRMVDMFTEIEQARSMLYFGAIKLSSPHATEIDSAIAMLKVKMGSASRLVGQTAVQLHGGMGVTEELDVGHMFKRLTMINTLFGSQDYHLDSLVKARQVA